MHHWTKRLIAVTAPLLLTGCLWGPGKFNSDLSLKKDGSFTLDYRGELVLQLPPDQTTDRIAQRWGFLGPHTRHRHQKQDRRNRPRDFHLRHNVTMLGMADRRDARVPSCQRTTFKLSRYSR